MSAAKKRAKRKGAPVKRISLIHLESPMPNSAMRRINTALESRAEQLQHLGQAMSNAIESDFACGDPPARERWEAAQSIRQLATTVRANATQAMLIAANAMELSGQLDGVATILESAQRTRNDDDG